MSFLLLVFVVVPLLVLILFAILWPKLVKWFIVGIALLIGYAVSGHSIADDFAGREPLVLIGLVVIALTAIIMRLPKRQARPLQQRVEPPDLTS